MQNEVVGKYVVVKTMAAIGGKVGMHTKEEVLEDLSQKLKNGETDEHDVKESTQMLDAVVEFTEDNKLITWIKIPEDLSDEELEKAKASGEIGEVRDGYFAVEETEWKDEDGVIYYDSKSQGEAFGEVQSPWIEFKQDEEGLYVYAMGMMRLKKL